MTGARSLHLVSPPPKVLPPSREDARRNLIARLVSAALLLPPVAVIVALGSWPFALLCALAAAGCTAELLAMPDGRVHPVDAYPVMLSAALALGLARGGGAWLAPGLVAATLGLLVVHVASTRPVEARRRSASLAALAWLAFALPLALLGSLRLEHGGGAVALALGVAWCNDAGAFFVGRSLGKSKLAPALSPAKTWEGFWGGLVAGIAGTFAVRALFLPTMGVRETLVVGLGAGLLGPLGDLAIAMLKRSFGLKDSSPVIPGHGGLLDRLASLLAIAPWTWLVLQVWPPS
ncbi:MAG: phosphatidate cytidylyltransferase [Deltaproteobacteria bacterium]|nr:phosphatidate cytidylyltransferase [Deltaproteobacteria bacterium]